MSNTYKKYNAKTSCNFHVNYFYQIEIFMIEKKIILPDEV